MLKKWICLAAMVTALAAFGCYVKQFKSKGQYVRIFAPPGRFNIPFADVEIQGKTYPFKINLDWTLFPLYLSENILSQMDKKPMGVVQIDVDGETSEVNTYLLPKIKIGDLFFNDILVMEVDDREKQVAAIGLKFFCDNNLLLDFPNSTIIMCDDLNRLKQAGYFIEEMAKTACEVGRKGLILKVNTDIGLIKLGVSSINTWSIVRSDLAEHKKASEVQVVTTSFFTIGGRDFGNKDLRLYDLCPKSYGADGCIGMDFLRKHTMYFDFKNKTVYIGDGLAN